MFSKKSKDTRSSSGSVKRQMKKNSDSSAKGAKEKKSGLLHYLFGKREKTESDKEDVELQESEENEEDTEFEDNNNEFEDQIDTDEIDNELQYESDQLVSADRVDSPHIIEFGHDDMRTMMNLRTGGRKSFKSPTGEWVSNPESSMKVISTTDKPYEKNSFELDGMTINIKEDGSIMIQPAKSKTPDISEKMDLNFPRRRRTL